MILWLTLVLAVLGGLALFNFGSASGVELPAELMLAGGAIALLIIVYLLTAKSYARSENKIRRAGFQAGLGALLIGGLAYGYNNHAPIQSYLTAAAQFSPDSAPDRAIEPRDGLKAVRIRRNPDGQYVARGGINQSAAQFLVDTGAAVVLLRQSDAEKAGIDIAALTFSVPVETANGTTYAAPVRVRNLTVGPIQVEGMEALVAAPGSLNESLLGISFLRRLRSYELAGDFMTLRE